MESINPIFEITNQEEIAAWGSNLQLCERWIPSQSNQLDMKCETSSSNYQFVKQFPLPIISMFDSILQIPINPIPTPQKSLESKVYLDNFFEGLNKFSTILNKDEVIAFLNNLPVDPCEITDMFLEVNKIVSSIIPDYKLFIEKYDDPETMDHFIAINVRNKTYPDDFIDKIWEIRDTLYKKFADNCWLLITTDYGVIPD